jgi:hypothetical protein
MKSKVRIAPLVSLLVAVIMLCCGCATSDPARPVAANGGKFFAVTANSTPFYQYGPLQGSGADKTLPKDTLVTLIRPSFGYCKVKLTTGEQGYVASDDIGAAPPALVAAANTPARPSGSRHFRFDPNDPRFAPPPEVNPEFEPTPIPSPPDSDN